jgi:hypothetical protein
MQIVETTNEGLKRAYTVTIPAKDIEARIDAEVKKIAPQVRMPGFRPGKVPANLSRRCTAKRCTGGAQHHDPRIDRQADAREEAAPGDAARRSRSAKAMSRARTPS